MTRTKPAEQRRAELLAAGRALFLAKGIAATSLDDITQRAGVSKGLFYLYFASKEDLVLALQEQFSREVAARMSAAADIQADWAARLDACVKAGFECYRELHDLHEVLFHHGHTARPDPEPAPATWSSPDCSRPARSPARWTCLTPNPPRCSATRACTPSTWGSAAAAARTTPGSSGPRSSWCAARPGCRSATRRRGALLRRRSPEKARGACNHGGQDGRSLPFCFRTRDNRATDRNDCGSLGSTARRRTRCLQDAVGSGRKGMGEWRR